MEKASKQLKLIKIIISRSELEAAAKSKEKESSALLLKEFKQTKQNWKSEGSPGKGQVCPQLQCPVWRGGE